MNEFSINYITCSVNQLTNKEMMLVMFGKEHPDIFNTRLKLEGTVLTGLNLQFGHLDDNLLLVVKGNTVVYYHLDKSGPNTRVLSTIVNSPTITGVEYFHLVPNFYGGEEASYAGKFKDNLGNTVSLVISPATFSHICNIDSVNTQAPPLVGNCVGIKPLHIVVTELMERLTIDIHHVVDTYTTLATVSLDGFYITSDFSSTVDPSRYDPLLGEQLVTAKAMVKAKDILFQYEAYRTFMNKK